MSAPVAVLRQPYIRVNINGDDVQSATINTIQGPAAPAAVIAATVQYGFDLQVATATVTCTGVPSGATYGQQIQIYMAASQAAATSQPARFVGIIVEFDDTHSPKSVDILCRGWLYAAQKFQIDNSNVSFGPDPFPQNGGVDLSANGHGWGDLAIVGSILNACQVQMLGIGGSLGGTDKLFGTVLPESCRWAEGQSGLDAIGMFDAICLGYRTYDTPGFVVRKQISIANLSADNVVATFTEGVDIFSGTGQRSILDTCGAFVVTGGTKTKTNPSNAAFFFSLAGTNGFTSAPEQTSSPLIEKSLAADPGPGLSCEEVANWRKGEMDHPLASISFDTPRDDYLQPGDTIRILSPWRLGANAADGLYWLQNVNPVITEEGVFTQTLTCIGAAQ